MKTLLTIAIIGSAIGFSNAQTVKEAEVPDRVKVAFTKQYPNVKVEKWEKEGANYEAEFKLDYIETSAVYDERGKFIQTESEIHVAELPPAVTEYVNTNLGGKKVSEASRITDASGIVSYEAEVGDADYLFDSKGSFIRKDAEDHDDKDDD